MKIEKKHHRHWNGGRVLGEDPRNKETKAQKDRWDYVKPRTFCTSKVTFSKGRRQLTEWDKIFANLTSYPETIRSLTNQTVSKKSS